MASIEFGKHKLETKTPDWLKKSMKPVLAAALALLATGGSVYNRAISADQTTVSKSNEPDINLIQTLEQTGQTLNLAKNNLGQMIANDFVEKIVNGEPGTLKTLFKIGDKMVVMPRLPNTRDIQNPELRQVVETVRFLQKQGKFTLDVNTASIPRQIKEGYLGQPALDLVMYLSQVFDSVHFSSLAEPSNLVMPSDGSSPNPDTGSLTGRYMHRGLEHKEGVAVDVTFFKINGKTYSALIGDNTRPEKVQELINYKKGDPNFVTDPTETRKATKFFIKHLINFARLRKYDTRIILGRGYEQTINDPEIQKMVKESNVKITFMIEESAHYNHFHIDMK